MPDSQSNDQYLPITMEQPPPSLPAVDPGSETPTVPPMSLSGRLLNIFATPGEVFDAIRNRPPSVANWLVPALLAVFVGWVGSWLIFAQPSVQHQLAEISEQSVEQQAARMKASPEQTEQMREAAAKYGAMGQKIGAFVMPVVASFSTPFIWGLFLWVVASKIMKAPVEYMKWVEVTGLASMIGVLDGVLKTLLVVVMGSLWAGPHPGMLVSGFDPQNNTLHGLLAALSIMTLWVLAVRALGLARLAGSSFAKAAAWVFGIWLAYTGVFLGLGFAVRAIFASK